MECIYCQKNDKIIEAVELVNVGTGIPVHTGQSFYACHACGKIFKSKSEVKVDLTGRIKHE